MRRQSRENIADQQQELLHSVLARGDDDHAERKRTQIVLPIELPIHGDQSIDLTGRAFQQVAVRSASPTQSLHGHHLVADQCCDQVVRESGSSRTRTRAPKTHVID